MAITRMAEKESKPIDTCAARWRGARNLDEGMREPGDAVAAASTAIAVRPSIIASRIAGEEEVSETPNPAAPIVHQNGAVGEVVHLQVGPPPPLPARLRGATTDMPIAKNHASSTPTSGTSKKPSTNPRLEASPYPSRAALPNSTMTMVGPITRTQAADGVVRNVLARNRNPESRAASPQLRVLGGRPRQVDVQLDAVHAGLAEGDAEDADEDEDERRDDGQRTRFT